MADTPLLESGDRFLLESASLRLFEGFAHSDVTGAAALTGSGTISATALTPPSPLEEGEPLFVPRTWIDFVDDLDAEAMNDLEARVSGAIRTALPAIYPEDFGAEGDGVTDDTDALQDCIDAAMAANGDVVIKLDSSATYLVNSAPRTDRHGNCILSIDGGAFSTKRLAITADSDYARGQDNPMPVIKTTRNSDSLFGVSTGLSATLTSGDTTAHVDDASAFPSSGAFICEKETILYTGKTSTTLTGLTRGVGGDDVTHDDTRSVYFTYGPPSVIGGRTVENGQLAGTEYTGTITIRNVRVEIAGDPTLAGIDGTSWGGMETNAVVKGFGGAAGVPKIATVVTLPTHPWAFGIRTPTGANYGYTRLANSLVSGMSVGHVFTACDHTTFVHSHSVYCALAFGFQAPIDRRHAIGGGYTMGEYCPTMIAGWIQSLGADDMPTGSGDCNLTKWVLDMEPSNPTADPGGIFDLVTIVQDANAKIRGDITIHHNTAGLGPLSAIGVVNGAANLKISVLHEWRTTVNAASNADLQPGQRISLVNASTTVINYLSTGYVGQVLTLVFQAATPVHHNQGSPADGHSPIMLHGSANFTAANGTVMTFIFDGTNWQEMSRTDP